MRSAFVLWMSVFALSAAVFFGIAAWVAVTGVRDVKDLLFRRTGDADPGPGAGAAP